jgi:hypothetical protein
MSKANTAEQNQIVEPKNNGNNDDFDDDWGDDSWASDTESSPWQYSGFIEAAYGHFTQNNVTTKNTPLKELRARLDMSYTHKLFDFTGKGDLLIDDVTADTLIQMRELNIKASPFDFLDVKIGKQILTWGTADYLFINDLFPKNWQSFFSGREDAYLKASSNSIKTSWFINNTTLDVVWTPEFTEDTYLTGERFSFYSKQAQQQVAPQYLNVQQSNDEQWFARLSTSRNSVEYALYGYKGRWTTPEGVSDTQQPYFPKMNAIGASLRTTLGNGLFNIEVASYNSIENSGGEQNPHTTPNNQQRFLVGYETELMKNLTLNAQYYIEHTSDYTELLARAAIPEQVVSKNRQLITTRLRYSALQQKLTMTLFNFYSPSDNDGFLKTSVSYRKNDQWLYTMGANLFWGKGDFSFFGQHQVNSNLWARVRFQY